MSTNYIASLAQCLRLWSSFHSALEQVTASNQTPADQFKHITSPFFHLSRADITAASMPLPAETFWISLMNFQVAMRYTVDPSHPDQSIDGLSAYSANPTAFRRDEELRRRIEEMRLETARQRRLDTKQFNMVSTIVPILNGMWEVGQTLRGELNEGVAMLLACYTAEETYEPAGDAIQIEAFSEPYVGQPEDCGVCLESTGALDAVVIACEHCFHRKCLRELVNQVGNSSNMCPYCRLVLCERRARAPGVTNHMFDQRSAIEAMRGIYFARRDMDRLKELYEEVFDEKPRADWLAGRWSFNMWGPWGNHAELTESEGEEDDAAESKEDGSDSENGTDESELDDIEPGKGPN
ncbi:uncharacterized protein BDZ99DRAFT_495789 [Mytilinidion resinicola]|uniref:RING-type domain-containing protein n=1 Tax=Mytilinidion resinicola TaxID=574789 RepID=A0A6A6YZK7_9PEZI|nr:uncharacterized protein BDZ99DRAFT_495789 [Mytilinidion resinicola]KAF2814271.1 hypothetical protein BDZ99DRAFT_495789 [Mytilinidion resinicola]